MGLCEATVARGRRDLLGLLQGQSPQKERKPVKGRPRTEEKVPSILATLEELLRDEVAVSPEGGERWVRSSIRKLAERLGKEAAPSRIIQYGGCSIGWGSP
jgi:hypothetical protein